MVKVTFNGEDFIAKSTQDLEDSDDEVLLKYRKEDKAKLLKHDVDLHCADFASHKDNQLYWYTDVDLVTKLNLPKLTLGELISKA